MVELLQLHAVIPKRPKEYKREEYDPDVKLDPEDVTFGPSHDDLISLFSRKFSVPNDVGIPDEAAGYWCSTHFFERRPDNMEKVDEIQSELQDLYPDAVVLRSYIDHSASMSISDPDAHLVISVTNWGEQFPSMRWENQKRTLHSPPLVSNDHVYHADGAGLFALDIDLGDEVWETGVNDVTRVPIATDEVVIGTGNVSVTALDALDGDVEWKTRFGEESTEFDEGVIIDSRMKLGLENAYAGLRNGQVRSISLDDGSWSTITEFDSSVINLAVDERGIVVATQASNFHLVNQDGSIVWTRQFDSRTPYSMVSNTDEDLLIATESNKIHGISLDSGDSEWTIETQHQGNITVFGDLLIITTYADMSGYNVSTGSLEWSIDVPDRCRFTTPSVTDDTITFIQAKTVPDPAPLGVHHKNTLYFADPTSGEVQSSFRLGYGDYYSPVLVDDGVICSTEMDMVCLDGFPEPRK